MSHEDSLPKSIELYQKALTQSESINYIKGIAKSSNRLGFSYTGQSKLAEATGLFYKGLKNAELIKDTSTSSSSYFGLGLVMYNMNNWEEAIAYFTKSLLLDKSIARKSTTEYLLALCLTELDQINKAKIHFLESKKYAELTENTGRLIEIRLALNNLKGNQKKDHSILTEYDSIHQYFMNSGEKVGEAYTLMGKANYFISISNYEQAQVHANQALNKVNDLDIIYPLQSILTTVTKAEYLNGNYQAAYDHNIEFQKIRDSIQGINAAAKVTLMHADYEFDKSRKILDDKIKSQNKQRIIWIVVAAVLALVVFSIFYLLKRVSKERKKSDALLLNILPAETALELKKNGKASAKAHKNVTIVFADIKGFTKIASGLSADVVVEMLDIYFGEFDQIMENYNLEKIKTIGDAYMFVNGLDGDSKSLVNAIDASRAMLEKSKALTNAMQEKYNTFFTFRFGLHIGEVVSGVVGSKKYAFDIWGDAVNIAARMEENSEPGRLNLSEVAYLNVREKYEFEARGKIEAKNRGRINMFYLIGPKL